MASIAILLSHVSGFQTAACSEHVTQVVAKSPTQIRTQTMYLEVSGIRSFCLLTFLLHESASPIIPAMIKSYKQSVCQAISYMSTNSQFLCCSLPLRNGYAAGAITCITDGNYPACRTSQRVKKAHYRSVERLCYDVSHLCDLYLPASCKDSCMAPVLAVDSLANGSAQAASQREAQDW